MAVTTDPALQRAVIYSVFVRNHTAQGTFRALIPDLPRIRGLGADIIWLMPIHPLGEKNRKGTLGSPYANRDYRAIHPAYGTIEDFQALAEAVHGLGMRLFIDVVYNHTAPDSVLWQEHPEFFYRNSHGAPGNRVGDWSDVIDLDYGNKALWDYQIQSLQYWAQWVDGFRCDASSLVPVDFWKKARQEVERVHPGCIWLGETLHRSFNEWCLRAGIDADRDADAFEAFDMEYDYDVREAFDAFLEGKAPLSHWLDLLAFQDFAYPKNYNKMRCLENHDQPRIASRVSGAVLESYTALLYFLKGATLLYAGQEAACTHLPSLFDIDVICWETGRDLSPLLRRLNEIKKNVLTPQDRFFAQADDARNIAVLSRRNGARCCVGVFPLGAQGGQVSVPLGDGVYEDLLTGETVTVQDGTCFCTQAPLILAQS